MPRPPYHGSRGARRIDHRKSPPMWPSSPLGCALDLLDELRKTPAARLGRRPEGRHPHRLAASLHCGCTLREGAMFPITKLALSFRAISDYWSRHISPPASSNELLDILLSAWWLGELRGDFVNSRFELLKIMFTSMYRDDLGIVFIVGDDAAPPPVEWPDGTSTIDLRPQIRVPSSNTESWDEAACTNAFHALAEVTEKSSIDSYREFAILLPSIKLTYEEFNIWLRRRGYSTQFWQHPDQAHSHHAGAASWPQPVLMMTLHISAVLPPRKKKSLEGDRCSI